MPFRIFGCGTWYHGRKNASGYTGTCRQCRRQIYLFSFDAFRWFDLLFIPTIPLGRVRVIEQCSACTRHAVMSRGEFKRVQNDAREVAAKYRKSPLNRALAKDSLKALAGLRELQACLDLAPEIGRNFPSDARTLAMVAAVFELFGHDSEAEPFLRSTVDQSHDVELSETLGRNLIRQGRPQEAAYFLRHIVDRRIADRSDALYELAKGFQRSGQHETALAVFDQCLIVNPALARDPTFARLREASEKNRGTNKIIVPETEIAEAKRAGMRRLFARAAVAAIVLILIAYPLVAVIKGQWAAIYFANALDRQYTVRVNGASYTLPPRAVTLLRFPEGDLTVQIVDAPPSLGPETVSIHTSFLTRPLASHTFVINPDGAAVLRQFKPGTTVSGLPASHPRADYFAGRTLYAFDGLNYEVAASRGSVQMDSYARSSGTDSLCLLLPDPSVSTSTFLLGLEDWIKSDAMIRVAQRHLLLEPARREYLTLLHDLMTPQDLIAFLHTELPAHQPDVEWHRAYQQAMSETGQAQEIESEFEAILSKDPANPTIQYLASMAATNPDRFLFLCQKATQGDSPCPYAFHALAEYFAGIGEHHLAAQYAVKAMALLAGDLDVRQSAARDLIADHQFDKALQLLQEDEAAPIPYTFDALAEEAYVYDILGNPDKAERCRITIGSVPELYGARVAGLSGRWLTAEAAYCRGDASAFDNVNSFVAHLSNGDVAAADADLAQRDQPRLQEHLLLYISAAHAGQTEAAARHLRAAADLLSQGGYVSRVYADALSGKPQVPLGDLLRLRAPISRKLLLVTALGLRNDAARAQCFSLARKLNWDRRFPHLLLNQVLQQPAAGS